MSASKTAGFVMAMMLGVSVVQAQPPLPSQFSVNSEHIKGDLDLRKDGLSIARTGTRSCGGKVEGRMRVLSNRIATVTRMDAEFPTCVLRIKFSRDYTRVKVTESNCNAWHGAGCDFGFNGVELRRRN